MKENLNREKLLRKKIGKILLTEWDPIGVRDILEAQDEYDAYVSPLYKLLISGKSEYEIFNYLWWIETEYMGLIGDKEQTEAIARKLRLLVHSILN